MSHTSTKRGGVPQRTDPLVHFLFPGSGEEVFTLREAAYAQARSSEDPLFHTALYDWMISRQMTDQVLEVSLLSFVLYSMLFVASSLTFPFPVRLLQMQTPFIESYLAKEPLSHPRANLLWQFYARGGNSAQAALVQAHLAQTLE